MDPISRRSLVKYGLAIGLYAPLRTLGGEHPTAFLLTAIRTNFEYPVEWIQLRRLPTNNRVTIKPGLTPTFTMIEVMPGPYIVSTVLTRHWRVNFNAKEAACEVLPGAICYIGDILLNGKGDASEAFGAYRHLSSEATLVAAVHSRMDLFKSLPTYLSLPAARPERVDALTR